MDRTKYPTLTLAQRAELAARFGCLEARLAEMETRRLAASPELGPHTEYDRESILWSSWYHFRPVLLLPPGRAA